MQKVINEQAMIVIRSVKLADDNDIRITVGGTNYLRMLRISNHLNFLLTLNALIQLSSAWIVDFNNPIVHTQYGSIRGKIDERKTKFNRRPICTFLSIPYARPPIGSNRFLVSCCTAAWKLVDGMDERS